MTSRTPSEDEGRARWVLRVYDRDSDQLVAEHELRDADQRDLTRILGFMPSAYVSTPLDGEALRRLDSKLRQPGRESWKDRELFLDFDVEPAGKEQYPEGSGPYGF